MPNRKFQKIDFTDPARHGGHVGNYVDGEKVAYLTFNQSPQRTANFAYVANDIYAVKSLWIASPQYINPYYAACNFHSDILPDDWFTEVFVLRNSYTTTAFMGIVDFDFDAFKYYSGQRWGEPGPQPFMMMALFDGSPQIRVAIRDSVGNLSGGFIQTTPASDVPLLYKTISWKRTSGVGFAYFKANGDYLFGCFAAASTIQNFTKKQRFSIGNGAVNYDPHITIRTILISGYKNTDLMDDVSALVTTDGTVEGGAPDAKTAVHDTTEATRIVLNTGQYIEIDLTNAAKDAPIHEIQITTDATDTNYLSTKLATNAMGAVWSVSVPMGNTPINRALGEKKSISFANSIRHIFYPEIKYLLGLSDTETEGCRKIRIENNSAVPLRVYEVDVVQGLQEIAFGDDAVTTDVIVDLDITDADVPIGSTGPAQEVNVRNTSESDTATCDVIMVDDGFYDPATAVVEYAAAPGGPWYDKLNPPPLPDGISIGPVIPEGNMPFYIRTKLPSSGELFQRFKAEFTVKMTNV